MIKGRRFVFFVRTYGGACKHVSRPMQTETRWRKVCSQIVEQTAEDIRVPPLWGKRGILSFFLIYLSRACTRRTFWFHVDTCRHPDKKLAHATIDLRSRHRINTRPTRFVSGKVSERRWRLRRYRDGPWSRGRGVARDVLRHSPKPDKKSTFCYRKGI